jgi:hypothetical protein
VVCEERKGREKREGETKRNETKRNGANEHQAGSGHEGSCMRVVSVIDGEVEVVVGDGAKEAPEAARGVDELEERLEELPLSE